MSKYYLFELPGSILSGLQPFKFDWTQPEPESPADFNSESSDSSESSDDDGSDTSDQDDIFARKDAAKTSGFSSAVTKYADEEDELSMEQWQWQNRAHITGAPYVYFTNSSALPEDKVLSVYKPWFTETQLIDSPVQSLRDLPSNGKSCILMVNSGNFAGAIIQHQRHHHKTNLSNPFANVIVLASKTFHRYTTRRKQGGAQSASDSAHGKANSAGSTIRRANERALQEEIRGVLQSWSPNLAECHKIFIRAPGRSNRQLLAGYQDAPIPKGDPRLVQIPFATGKPTLNECKSAWLQLTQALVLDAPKPPPPAPSVDASRSGSPQPDTTKTKSKSPDPASMVPPEQAEAERKSAKLVDLIKRSKLPAIKQVIEQECEGNWDFNLEPQNKYFAYPTPLLYAAHFDKQNVAAQLLKWGASPLVKNEQGQSLGDIASANKKTRESLQIARKELGEEKWDWKRARVGPPLTREQINDREKQEKQRVQKENEQLAAEQDKREKEQRMERLINKHGSGKLVGGLYEASRGFSEDELRQVERERRARAAEARLKRLENNK